MATPRSAFGAGVVHGSIFAVGGSDGQVSQRSVERYDPAVDRWVAAAGMTTRRENLGVTVIDGEMYAAGGYDSMWGDWLRSSERYVEGQPGASLVPEADLLSHRNDQGRGAWVLEADLRRAGSWEGRQAPKDPVAIRRQYDEGLGAWVPEADLLSARRNLALLPIQGELVALGGHDGTAPVTVVEHLLGRGTAAAQGQAAWRAHPRLSLPTDAAYYAAAAS
ncbi:hypothetical protein T484DRAFT_1843024 [Baffinella frigidus]|nr:hypothetical protein T484DRAFT_1843024 [Cryptophyta sp. CCMP2293]